MTRETSYAALFALLQQMKDSGTIKVCDRRVRLLEQMEDGELPALFMAVDNQKVEQKRGFPAKHTLAAKVYLYAANPDEHTAAGIQLNGLLDAVEVVLAPHPVMQVQTLGGAVSHVWIEGATEIFEGPLGQRAAAIITINMLVP